MKVMGRKPATGEHSEQGRALFALMESRELTRDSVASTLGVTKATVNAWLAPSKALRHRNCPPQMIELLDLKTRPAK